MTSVRGDDYLLSIMEEMSGDFSKQEQDSRKGGGKQASSSPIADRIRLIPEVTGYGNEVMVPCPDSGLNGNIWNPYIQVPSNVVLLGEKCQSFLPPTNPFVEVSRRRAYEKFKKKFQSIFNFLANNAAALEENQKVKSTEMTENETHKMWKDLPAHSILERWHFACKLNESLTVLENIKNQTLPPDESRTIAGATTDFIVSLLIERKDSGSAMDPILISSFTPKQEEMHTNFSADKRAKRRKIDQTAVPSEPSFASLNQLMQNEIIFQWKREWKKRKGSSEVDWSRFFESPKFKRRVKKIGREINDLALEIERDFLTGLKKKAGALGSASSSTSKKKGKNKSVPKISYHLGSSNDTDSFITLTYSGLSFRISNAHFEKLQILFDRANPGSTSLTSHRDSFYSASFCLLARYDMLEGAGLQSSLNGNVFEVLLEHFGCKMECFASPFNCRYEKFCSAFPDSDKPFGSLGSFFNYDFEALSSGGCFQANPPFAADFILSMYKRMEYFLTKESIDFPLMFVVFIPAWTESDGWNAINESSVLERHILLSQKDDPHYYCEGTQHRRLKERYRIASFDTSVFFLQNNAARTKWPLTDIMIQQLKDAFSSKFVEENQSQSWKRSDTANAVLTHHKDDKSREGLSVDQINSKIEKCSNLKESKRKNKACRKVGEEKGKKGKKKLINDNSGESQLKILSSLGIIDEKAVTANSLNSRDPVAKVGHKATWKRRRKRKTM